MSIQHIDDNQRVFGPDPNTNPVEFFINPIGIQSLVLSALDLGASTTISMDTLTAFSANVNLLPSPEDQPVITFPLVQGMGFITAIYNAGNPILQTGVLFRSVTKVTRNPKLESRSTLFFLKMARIGFCMHTRLTELGSTSPSSTTP